LWALALGAGVAGAQGHGGHGGDEAGKSGLVESMEELEGMSGREFELGYVNRIVPHHEGAVEMAELVKDMAPHKQVRELAARIIEDQNREIRELTGFLKREYGVGVDPDERQMMDHGMMAPMHDEPGSAIAEKMFLLMMREHHQGALDLGNLALEEGTSPEIRRQARGMIESQRAEQDLFARWLRDWYGIRAPEPTGDMMAAARFATPTGLPDTGEGGLRRREGATAAVAAAALGAVAGVLLLRRRLA
jgi:uncharacterized protein (DUF305 family)